MKDGNSSGSLTLEESKVLILELSENYLQTTIIIDALDECDRDTRRGLFSALNTIATSTSRVKIFLTSRYDSDIYDMFCSSLNYYLDPKDNSHDINAYIDTQMEQRCDPTRQHGVQKLLLKGNVDPELKSEVIATLQRKANGMYLSLPVPSVRSLN